MKRDAARIAPSLFLMALTLFASITPYWSPARATGANLIRADWAAVLAAKQAPVRASTFGTAYAEQFIRLSLSTQPVELQSVSAVGPAGEACSWTTAFLGPEMLSQARSGELPALKVEALTAVRAQAHLIVGTLAGPPGASAVVGLYHATRDTDGTRYFHIVPIGQAAPSLIAFSRR